MKEIPLILRFGGAHNRSREIKKEVRRKLYKGVAGCLNGYTEAKVNPAGFKVWINTRQTDRDMVDTFFHEMTHVLMKINFTRKKFRRPPKRHEEALCRWIGYLARTQFADMLPGIFGRRQERKAAKK